MGLHGAEIPIEQVRNPERDQCDHRGERGRRQVKENGVIIVKHLHPFIEPSQLFLPALPLRVLFSYIHRTIALL